jgi:hypothetical protein
MNDLMRRILLLLIVICVFPGSGCGEKLPPGLPKLNPCSITIMQEGKPLAGATVSLHSEDSSLVQWNPVGITDQNGVCVLRTQGKYSGAASGMFKVTVSKIETEPSKFAGGPPVGVSTDEWDKQRIDANEILKSWRLVDKKYGSSATTDLTIEVTSGQNAQTFDVGAAIRSEL